VIIKAIIIKKRARDQSKRATSTSSIASMRGALGVGPLGWSAKPAQQPNVPPLHGAYPRSLQHLASRYPASPITSPLSSATRGVEEQVVGDMSRTASALLPHTPAPRGSMLQPLHDTLIPNPCITYTISIHTSTCVTHTQTHAGQECGGGVAESGWVTWFLLHAHRAQSCLPSTPFWEPSWLWWCYRLSCIWSWGSSTNGQRH